MSRSPRPTESNPEAVESLLDENFKAIVQGWIVLLYDRKGTGTLYAPLGVLSVLSLACMFAGFSPQTSTTDQQAPVASMNIT